MASNKRCVIALKRQHWVAEETDDIVVNSSLNKLNQFLDRSRESVNSGDHSQEAANSSTENDSVFERGSQSPAPGPSTVMRVQDDTIVTIHDTDTEECEEMLAAAVEREPDSPRHNPSPCEERKSQSPAPGPSIVMMVQDDTIVTIHDTDTEECEEMSVAAAERGSDSPQFVPSHYEDITFEPLVTSTPHHIAEAAETSVEEEIAEALETSVEEKEGVSECDMRGIRMEMRNGKTLLNQVEFEFVRDIRQTLKKKSTKHVTKLRERRINVAKRISQLKKQRKRIDDLLTALNDEKDAIDDTLHKFNYFIENFPL